MIYSTNSWFNHILAPVSLSFIPLEKKMVITIDSGTTLILKRDPKDTECEVCSVGGSSTDCSPAVNKKLTNVDKLSLEFSCLKPEDVYSVEMTKKIGENSGDNMSTFISFTSRI